MAGGIVLACASVFALPPNHDVSWLLYVGQRLLAGDRMFVEIVEVNPPLIVWASTGIVALSGLLHLAPLRAFAGLVLLLCFVSAWLSWRLLRRALPDRAPTFVAAVLVVLIAIPGYDFGQREHLLVALVIPYLVAAGLEFQGTPSRSLVGGLLAGVGLALKPHFCLVFLAIEALLLVRRGASTLRRPEPPAIASVLVAYAAAVLVLEPGYLREAVRLSPYYAPFARHSVTGMLHRPGAALSVTLLLAMPVLRAVGGSAPLAPVMGVGGLALLLAAAAQGKGFPYHWYPALSLSLLATIDLLLGTRSRWRGPLTTVLVVLLPFVALVQVLAAWRSVDAPLIGYSALKRAMGREARGRPVLALTGRTRAVFPAVESLGLTWDSPYPFLWMLPAIYGKGTSGTLKYHSRAEMDPLERQAIDGIWRLVERRPPGVILVDRLEAPWLPRGFSHEAYFQRDPRFHALLERCRWVAEVAAIRICRL